MTYKQFINGEFVDSSSGESYEVRNPANGNVVDQVARGNVEDAKAAIDFASDALKREKELEVKHFEDIADSERADSGT